MCKRIIFCADCANILFRVEANFSKHPDANPPSRRMKLCRFPANPIDNWGPLAKAKPSKTRKMD